MIAAQVTAYTALDDFVEFITASPTLEQISEYRLSDHLEARISYLLDANKNGVITPDEEKELDDYLHLEHFMRMVKIRAFEKLDQR